MKNNKNIFIGALIVVLFCVVIILVKDVFFTDNSGSSYNKEQRKPNLPAEPVKPEIKLNIVDTSSNSRPYAVMINNLNAARPYHSGLQDAYLVYEIIVEGGITRMMAVFKDKNTARIGSVRSSRHYYLDYALENDAIYVHYGWSPQAKSDISNFKINNINGMYDSDAFWREKLNVAYEHTAFTSMEKIKSVANNKKYRLTTDKKLLLNYSPDEIGLEEFDNKLTANNISIKYSNYMTTGYTYNSSDKLYYRTANGKAHTDYITKKQYTTKNIIIAYASNGVISNDEKGRQELNNIGTGFGYYITNGLAVPITWEKKSRESQTVYKYTNGKEIVVNDGNTFIQIAPKSSATIK